MPVNSNMLVIVLYQKKRGIFTDKDWLLVLQQQNQWNKVVETGKYTEKFGLVLSEQDARLILQERGNSLREQRALRSLPREEGIRILTEHDRAYRNGMENLWEIVFAIKDGGTEEGNVI